MQGVGADLTGSCKGKAGGFGKAINAHSTETGLTFSAQREASSKADELIHEIGLQKGSRKRAAAFAEDTGEAAGCERLKERGWVDLSTHEGAFDEGGAKVAPCGGQLCRGVFAVAEPERDVFRGARQFASERQVEAAGDDDAHGLAGNAQIAHGEAGIVSAGGTGANHYCVMGCALRVDEAAGFGAGDPLAFARRGSDPAIKTGCEFEADKGTVFVNFQQETRMVSRGLLGPAAGVNLNASRAEHVDALPVYTRIIVFEGYNNAGHLRIYQRLSARRSLAYMGAGLQRDIGRRVFGERARLGEGHDLCMGATAGLSPAAPDDAVVTNEHAAYGGVRPNLPLAATTKGQGETHIAVVACCAHSSGGTSGRSSLTNLSKSSAAWKFL